MFDPPAVALVGSRKCSYYGEKVARRLSADLAEAGISTVSGFARGIDSHVHDETLVHGGRTWAVLGSGLSVLYPSENKRLAERIEASGALISEFPMKTTPFPANFPRRNRIIAGLSQGTVVIEGQIKSGALITARLAADAGREVYAVPGPITSALSAGPHYLLHMGAKMVTNVDDILEEIPGLADVSHQGSGGAPGENNPGLTEEENRLLLFLGDVPVNKDVLALKIKKDPRDLAAVLLEMELRGLVRLLPGGAIVRK
jgi:DNA processing protein